MSFTYSLPFGDIFLVVQVNKYMRLLILFYCHSKYTVNVRFFVKDEFHKKLQFGRDHELKASIFHNSKPTAVARQFN